VTRLTRLAAAIGGPPSADVGLDLGGQKISSRSTTSSATGSTRSYPAALGRDHQALHVRLQNEGWPQANRPDGRLDHAHDRFESWYIAMKKAASGTRNGCRSAGCRT
jgi:hypothetical protein